MDSSFFAAVVLLALGVFPALALVAPSHSANSSLPSLTAYALTPSFDPCPNDGLRLGRPSAELPDCRAYEQATPADKNGGGAGGELFRIQASVAGDGITSLTKAGLPGGEGSQSYPTYLSRRGALGWSTQGFLPPPTYGHDAEVLGWTPDLDYSLSRARSTDGPVFSTEDSLLLRSSATRAIQQVTPYLNGVAYAFVASSADDSRLFFEASGPAKLTDDAADGRNNLYLYEPESAQLSLVGVLPGAEGGGAPAGGSSSAYGRGDLTFTEESHTVSADGDKAFFAAGETGQLYLREGLSEGSPETVRVSVSQRSIPDPNGGLPAKFATATPSGSTAFFTSCQKLTNDSTAHSTPGDTCVTASQGNDLYAYDTASRHLSDLTVDGGDPQGAEVMGVIGASEDGSFVYFVANGDLDDAGPGEPGDCEQTGEASYAGTCNLYVWHGGASTFVARLDLAGNLTASDAANWLPLGVVAGEADRLIPASVSSDGEVVVFRSRRSLTAYDSGGAVELYRYRFGDDAPVCVSCNPSGQPPDGVLSLSSIESGIPTSGKPILKRFVSSSGERVFFETSVKLVEADVNGDDGCALVSRPTFGVPSCQDVYEWEAPGAGSCNEASPSFSLQDGGCLYLITSGTGPDPAYLGDASASGDDVFVFTSDQLVPGDRDQLYDIYDARVGGGLLGQNQVPPPGCDGDTCRGDMSTPLSSPAVGSASFPASVEPAATRCRKGLVRRHGGCVKPKKAKRRHPLRNTRGNRGGRG